MNLALTIDLYCTGTSEGAKKAWDSRGRGSDRPTPIKVKSVEEAIPLIRAGKVVELPDTKSVHTLLEKLAKLNERGQHYDLCNVTVKGTNLFCADNIGIARIDMPQFSGYPKPGSLADKLPKDDKGGVNGGEEFIKHLKNIGIATAAESVPAAFLRSSQRELIGTKVADMMEKKGRSLLSKKPIFISRDNYVVDGHHRWAAIVGLDAGTKRFGNLRMNVYRVDAPISEILQIGKKWSKEFGIDPKGVE